MMTFKQFSNKLESIPASTSWYLANLGEARGTTGTLYPAGAAEAENPAGTRPDRKHRFIQPHRRGYNCRAGLVPT